MYVIVIFWDMQTLLFRVRVRVGMRNRKEESSEGHGDRVGGRNRGIKPRFSSGAHLSYRHRKIIIWILVDLSWELEMRKHRQNGGRQGGDWIA
jgi:hypothetical protein